MARQQDTEDDELRLKRQARHRLIGAVALLTAVVVILPMVLDKEPKPTEPEIDLRIPDADQAEPFRPQTPLAASQPATALVEPVAPAAPLSAEPQLTPAAGLVTPPESVKMTEPAKVVEPTKPAEPAAGSVKSAEKKSSDPAPKSIEDVIAANDRADSKPAHFVLQIGSYSSAEVAHDWQKKLTKQGFHAYTEKSGDKTRLRVGPFNKREAAEKSKQKLQAAGLHPELVATDK